MANPSNQLHFDPDLHPDNTLKAFNDFLQDFELRYAASYPDPPKVSLDAAIQRWKITNGDKNPSVDEYDAIVEEWQSKDMISKLLGLYSSRRLFNDWKVAVPEEKIRKNATWDFFVGKLRDFYRPTENATLKHFQFRNLAQDPQETFMAFCNRVEKEAAHCFFKCDNEQCSADSTAIRDQVVIGTWHELIREEALKNSWCLADLRKEGMRLESAAKGAAEIGGQSSVHKIGAYSRRNNKGRGTKAASGGARKISCYFCGFIADREQVIAHGRQCPARSSTCENCKQVGHSSKVCKKTAVVNELGSTGELDESSVYNVNLFRLKESDGHAAAQFEDFHVQVVVNNKLGTVLADTGARVSVCGRKQAEKWNLLDRMTGTSVKIKPYKSAPIPAIGQSVCSVVFGDRAIPVKWHIIEEACEPVLSGLKAKELGIIQFQASPNVFMPVNMIKGGQKAAMQDILSAFPENFSGLGTLRGHPVNLQMADDVKPVAEVPRRIPYHLKSRVEEGIQRMMRDGVIEEHPNREPAPWVSNIVIAPKDDGDIRITLDAKNVNKGLKASNYPIPRQEDIKARLTGKKLFSKLDLKSAYWQLEIDESSRKYTVFHACDKLYRYKRLVMGLKCSQGELNAALQPIFASIKTAHVIHDDGYRHS